MLVELSEKEILLVDFLLNNFGYRDDYINYDDESYDPELLEIMKNRFDNILLARVGVNNE